ncbi:MAG: 2-methylfumaryl-CoA isomerase [Alphaproteobacteria bacterium]|jgi:2-methylfumaryl-CoA isomerase|nr:2-methylfumaryl-CoA isomerase [Alphaproteobacteria bacterium]
MTGPLTGMTVIEVSAFIAAPYAGLTLAQMGAEVIRIDPIGGGLDYNRWPVTDDGKSLYWAGLNKGKKSVTLNVRDPKGRELAHALMTASGPGKGIVVTNLPARGWLDYEGLKAMRDDLIMINIVGRRDGSVALDYTVNARAGFPLITGPEGSEGPVNHVMPVWDVVTALAASNAVLVADRHRRDTGEGQYVRIALADSAFAVLSHLGYVAEAQINGTDRPATGNHVFGTFGCDFPTSDNRRVMITAFTPRHWSALLEATGTTERFAVIAAEHGVDLAREEERYALRNKIEAELAPWFAARPVDEIGTALDAVGACWGPYQSVRQAVADDPDLSTENPMFEEIDQPGIGRYLAAGSFIDFGAIPRDPVVPAPTLGSDTESILAEKLGLSDADLGGLRDSGVI